MSRFRNVSLEFGFIAQGELYLEQNFGMIWGKFPVQLFYFIYFFSIFLKFDLNIKPFWPFHSSKKRFIHREVKIDGQPYKESPLLARKHAILSAPWKDKSSQQVQQKWSKSMADRLKRNHLSLQDNTCNSVHRERIKVRGSEFLLLQRRNTNLTRIDICLKTFGADGFRCLLIRKV